MAEQVIRTQNRKNQSPKWKAKPMPQKNRLGRRTFVLDEDLHKLIRKEARELNLSEEEFLRLMLNFSEVMRTSILPAGLLDGGMLKMLISNPIVLEMLKNMVGNVVSQFGQNKQSSTPQIARGHAYGGQQGQWGGMQGWPGASFRQHPPGGQAPSRMPSPGNPFGEFGSGPSTGQWGTGPGMQPMGPMPGFMGQPFLHPQPHLNQPHQPNQPQQSQAQQPTSQQQSATGFSLDGLTKLFMQFLGSQ